MGSPPENARSRSFDRPLLQVGQITATRGYADGRPQRIALSESNLTDGVETSSSFELFFDRFLWPRTVTRQAICLHPATQEVTRPEECSEPGQAFTQPEYDPVRRAVTFRQLPGGRLAPATQFRLTVFVAEADDAAGFLAFDGAPMARRYVFDFVTKASQATATDEPAPSKERYCAAQKCAKACSTTQKACKAECKTSCASSEKPEECETTCIGECAATALACKAPCGCLDGAACQDDGDLIGEKPVLFRACGFAPCHSQRIDPDPTLAAQPPLGLDLSAPGTIAATAIGTTAHLSQTGEAADVADRSGNRFGRAMPLIEPSNPGNSFLLYKLLINGRNFSEAELGTSLSGEIARLRAGAVPGIPMPAPSSPGSNQLDVDGAASQKQLQLISDWIAAGAVLSCE